MTYFGFLLRYVVIPLVVMAAISIWDWRRLGRFPAWASASPAWLAVLLHAIIALVYTTPWDNYLVATRVWWYDPDLVTGVTLGWVPIEEYTFFVLQSLLTGLVVLALLRRLQPDRRAVQQFRAIRWSVTGLVAVLWLASLVVLAVGPRAYTYLAIQWAWGLLPILIQVAFGADILWRYRNSVLLSLGSTTLYLASADALAIFEGTWTIDPEQSLHILLGGILPLEEATFFLITNTLLVFGITLLLAPDSLARLPAGVRARIVRIRPSSGQVHAQPMEPPKHNAVP